MTELRKADPATRRRAVLLVVASALVGVLLIGGFQHYRTPLREWLASEPGELAPRVTLVFFFIAAALTAPLLAFAVYLWSLGGRVLHARAFPPPGSPVLRDTRVTDGQAAVLRGRVLRALALALGAASGLLCLLLWQLARTLRAG